MPTLSLASMLIQTTKDRIYQTGLGIAAAIGLPVSSWQPGDPSRSLIHLEAETLATLEPLVSGFIASGFLDYASGFWLKLIAQQVYGVEVPDATFATTDETLTNTGGGDFTIEPGDLTFKSSLSGKTFRNTTGGHLGAVGTSDATLTVTVVADEAGSESSAGAGEIDELVTTLLGVTCTNALAATGLDEQDEATTRQQCRDSLGALSPNGPKDAYRYVATNSKLTGTNGITRVRAYADSDTGDVTVYLAGPSGAVSSDDRSKAEAAIATWATPLCITPTVLSAANVPVAVTYSLWVYTSVNKTTAEIEADVEAALEQLFATRDIGGDIIPPAATGSLYKSLLESTIRGLYPDAFRVSVTTPSSDTSLANGEVATLGTVTPTIVLVSP